MSVEGFERICFVLAKRTKGIHAFMLRPSPQTQDAHCRRNPTDLDALRQPLVHFPSFY